MATSRSPSGRKNFSMLSIGCWGPSRSSLLGWTSRLTKRSNVDCSLAWRVESQLDVDLYDALSKTSVETSLDTARKSACGTSSRQATERQHRHVIGGFRAVAKVRYVRAAGGNQV